ncbi:MAG TPA: sensor histidine kinase KdpD [Dehalococcoidia bacterium]|nr:sensor histidine kinase KdpD [Dehalococcoidia bacterium]
MTAEEGRPSPDALLARVKRQEKEGRRGRLRIYLGAFPGVGKTYAMLDEAHRRKTYGEDVLVGFVETHGRKKTEALLQGLEVIPRKRIEYKGAVLEEMDVEAVLERRPAVCLVDELAHTNAPGSERQKRYEDVQVLLNAGITVVSTLNIQHLESLNDTIESLTGVKVNETLPDSVLDEADEVILVDLSPEGARARMEHGHIYPPEQARTALENFFRPENLAALRELALKRTAEEVDQQLEELMRETVRRADTEEQVLVLVDETPGSRKLIRHGWRLAHGLRATLMVAYIKHPLSEAGERELARTLELAEDLNAIVRPIAAEGDELRALTGFIETIGIEHVVLPYRRPGLLRRPLADRLLQLKPDLEVHLVSA